MKIHDLPSNNFEYTGGLFKRNQITFKSTDKQSLPTKGIRTHSRLTAFVMRLFLSEENFSQKVIVAQDLSRKKCYLNKNSLNNWLKAAQSTTDPKTEDSSEPETKPSTDLQTKPSTVDEQNERIFKNLRKIIKSDPGDQAANQTDEKIRYFLLESYEITHNFALNSLKRSAHLLEKFIADPNTESSSLLISPEYRSKSHPEQIDHLWLRWFVNPFEEVESEHKTPLEKKEFEEKRKELLQQINQIIEIRRNQYSSHIQNLGKDARLDQAKKWYLESLTKDEKAKSPPKIEAMTWKEILPLMQARVQNKDLSELRKIEMQELLKLSEKGVE